MFYSNSHSSKVDILIIIITIIVVFVSYVECFIVVDDDDFHSIIGLINMDFEDIGIQI